MEEETGGRGEREAEEDEKRMSNNQPITFLHLFPIYASVYNSVYNCCSSPSF